MSLQECVMFAFSNKDFVREWERLRGVKLFPDRSPVETMIDNAAGFDGLNEGAAYLFYTDVKELLWERM